jgi:hypothetical protein
MNRDGVVQIVTSHVVRLSSFNRKPAAVLAKFSRMAEIISVKEGPAKKSNSY